METHKVKLICGRLLESRRLLVLALIRE